MTENSSGSSTAISFGSMIDGMFTFSAMFLAYSIRRLPADLPLASFVLMKSGSSLLISSHSVLPSFKSEPKFLSLCSTAFELTRSSSAVFDASALFRENLVLQNQRPEKTKNQLQTTVDDVLRTMLTSSTPSAMRNLSACSCFQAAPPASSGSC